MKKQQTIKIWAETRRLAKMLAASQDKTMVSFLHELVVREAAGKKLLFPEFKDELKDSK